MTSPPAPLPRRGGGALSKSCEIKSKNYTMHRINNCIFTRIVDRSRKPEVTSDSRLPSSNFFLKFILCCFLIFLEHSSFSQQSNIDSLRTLLKIDKEDTSKISHLLALGNEIRKTSYDTALTIAIQALKLSDSISKNFSEGSELWIVMQLNISNSYLQIGRAYEYKGDYYPAIEKYFKGIEIVDVLKQKNLKFKLASIKKLESELTGNIGNIYLHQGYYPKALDYYFKALKMAENLENKSEITKHLGNIGELYRNQGDYPKALDYYLKALKIAEELGNKKKMGIYFGNIGSVYENQGDLPKALDYCLKALKIAEDLGNKNEIERNLGNIGVVYADQGDNLKALDYYCKALRIAEGLGEKRNIAMWLGNIASVNISLLKYKDAEGFLHKAIEISDSIGLIDEKKEFEKTLSQLYNTTGRYQLSYEHYKIYSQLKDSVFNIEKTKDLTRKEMNYEFEKKEAVNKAEQDKQIAVAAATRKKQLIKLASVVGGLFLLLVVLGTVVRSLKIARKQKSIIEDQKFIIEKKQKEIVDSIRYGKRIQKAVITSQAYIKQHLKRDFFILFKPKDIVSGDFYWALQHHNKFYMITADSTGHGVPGAFMSLLNISFLNEAIVERGIKEPHEVLNYVREEIIKALNAQSTGQERRDGMDAVLCCYDFEKMELHFAAANNPLWLFRNGEITEYKPDKMPVGKYSEETKSFSLQTIALQKGDTVYTITDGYGDQFGGVDNKKFGKKTLKNKLSENSIKSMPEQKDILLKTFNDWKGNLEQIDDVSVIGVKI